jgi:hypothetical protein
VEERLRFVARLLEGEKMAVPFREFETSGKTDPLGEIAVGDERHLAGDVEGIPTVRFFDRGHLRQLGRVTFAPRSLCTSPCALAR